MRIVNVSIETVVGRVFFLFSKSGQIQNVMPFNKVLINLACSSRTGEIGPRSFLCGPSALLRSGANISKCGPCAMLVWG